MKDSVFIFICAFICVAAISIAAGYILGMDEEGDEEQDYFGLSSTKLTLTPSETYSMTVWDIPDGKDYEDIVWTSDDESTVMVDNGVITAVDLGEATITATVKSGGETFRDTCVVTVSDTKESKLTVYDAYSSDMDYAVLSGEGFDDGLLFLTFNKAGNVVISMPGYSKSWLSISSSRFIGNVTTDFSTVTMKVSDDSGTVATSTYKNSDSRSHSGVLGTSSNESAYSSLMSIEGLDYGEYEVTFTLAYGTSTVTVSGSFDYCRGDGLRDTSSTYKVSYAWKYDADEDGSVSSKETFSSTLTYNYSDYWNSYMHDSKLMQYISNGIANYRSHSECASYCKEDDTVDSLCTELKSWYTQAVGTTDYSGQQFAQFVLAFGQICYAYEYDDTQYYKFEDEYLEGSDVWAFPTETISSGCGDCDCTSILMATLMTKLGYDAALVILPSHMMCAIALDDFTDHGFTTTFIPTKTEDDLTYYFCETTADSPVTGIKKSILGDYSYQHLVKFKNNTGYYGFTYHLVGMVSSSFEGESYSFYVV